MDGRHGGHSPTVSELSDFLIFFGIGLAMLLGIAGVFVPVIPDLILIWGGALAYGLFFGWGTWGPWLFALITLLGLIGLGSEIWVSGWGARKGGAATWSIVGGFVVSIVALFLAGPLGFLLGLLGGIFVFELIRHRDAKLAAQATFGTGVGYGASFVVKLLLALGMVAAFIIWIVVG